MKIRTLVAGAAIVATGLLGAGAPQAAEVQRAIYVGVIGDLTQQCSPVVVGGGCFDIEEGTSAVRIDVEDAFNTQTGFRVDFRDAAGARIGSLFHGCATATLDVPAGAVLARVAVDGPLAGPSACGVALPNGIGTAGEIVYTPVSVS